MIREWGACSGCSGTNVNKCNKNKSTKRERVVPLVGDSIYQINGEAVCNQYQLKEIARRLNIGQTMEVLVLRKGEVKTLKTVVHRKLQRSNYDRWGAAHSVKNDLGLKKLSRMMRFSRGFCWLLSQNWHFKSTIHHRVGRNLWLTKAYLN